MAGGSPDKNCREGHLRMQTSCTRKSWKLAAAWCGAALLWAAAVPAAYSQAGSVGTVSVTVNDPAGAAIPEANLELKDVETNVTQKGATQASGSFAFPYVAYGKYKLTVSKAGFESQVISDIEVQTGRTTDIKVALRIGTTQQTVTVEGESPLVESDNSVLADTIDTKQVSNLPLQGRNMFSLALLVPGWASTGITSTTTTNGMSTAGTFDNLPGGAMGGAEFDGTQAISNRFRSGGFTYGTSVVQPRIEDVAEMTIQTAQLDLSGNGVSAMRIAVVTRRGTNQFHGRLFEDFQNTDLNANAWSNNARNLPRNIVKLNDFGGSVGGPIWKNKLFFFGTYAESIQPQSITATANVLSAGAQTGIFQYKASNGSIQSVNVLRIGASAGGPGTVNSQIGSQLSAINGVLGAGVLSPTSDPNISTLNWQYAARRTIYYPALRFDYNLNEAIRLNVSYTQTKTVYPGANAAVFPGGIDTVDLTSSNSNDKIAGFGVDWTIRPTLINQFHGGYMYQYSVFDPENENIDLTKVFPQAWAYGTSELCQQHLSAAADLVVLPAVERLRHAELAEGQPPIHLRRRHVPRAGPLLERTGRLSHHDPGHRQQRSDPEPLYQSALGAAGLTTSQQSSAEGLYATLTGRVSAVAHRRRRTAAGCLDRPVQAVRIVQSGRIDVGRQPVRAGSLAPDAEPDPELRVALGHRGRRSRRQRRLQQPRIGGRFLGADAGGRHLPAGRARRRAESAVHRQDACLQNVVGESAARHRAGMVAADQRISEQDSPQRQNRDPHRMVTAQLPGGRAEFLGLRLQFGSILFPERATLSPDTTGAVGTFQPGSLTLGQPLPPYALFPTTWAPTLPASTLTFGNSFFAMNPNIRQPYTEQWNFGIERQTQSRQRAGSALRRQRSAARLVQREPERSQHL